MRYRFDCVRRDLIYCGCPDPWMYDKEKDKVFNCYIPIMLWSIVPKIGDIIEYFSSSKMIFDIFKITVNGIEAYNRPIK